MGGLITVIPVFNGERFILPTLESVARQTRLPDRIVVLDNCSTDRTREIVTSFKNIPVELRQNECNLGLFGNMNRALEFAPEADYLHLLTADDLVLPRFYELVVSELEKTPGEALGFSRFELVDGTGNKLPPWWYIDYKDNGGPARRLALQAFIDQQSKMQTILLPAAIFKTKGRKLGVSFRETLPMHADAVLLAEWAAKCGAVFEVPAVLAQYRIHQDNATRRLEKEVETMTTQEWNAMLTISALSGRTGFSRWLYQQKLKCLFSARLHVGIERLKQNHPHINSEVRSQTRSLVSPMHWTLGGLAVTVRDSLNRLRNRA